MVRHRVTIVDVGHAAGVSRSTVSLVLRGDRSIPQPTVKRVKAVMARLGYVYNRGAASLRKSSSKVLGVVIHDLTNSVFSEIAVGVDLVSQSDDYVQFIAHSGDSLERQRSVIASMREHGIAGLIVSPALGTPPDDFRRLIESGIPVVQVGRSIGAPASTVVSDNAAGAASAVDYLYELGHRDIAFLGGFRNTGTFLGRVKGYRNAFRRRRLTLRASLIIESAPSRAGGIAAIEQLLSLKERCSAILCFNDAVAFGVCEGLRSAGLSPAKDISVVGFDDVAEAKSVYPALTTVSIDPQKLGQTAANLLLKQIASGDDAIEHLTIPVRLVLRESCRAPVKRSLRY